MSTRPLADLVKARRIFRDSFAHQLAPSGGSASDADSERSERRAPGVAVDDSPVTRGADSAAVFGLSSGAQIRGSATAVESSALLGKTTKNPSGVAAKRLRDSAKRSDRWALQQLLWKISTLPRVAGCRRRRLSGAEPSVRLEGGVAHFAGVQLCGSIWSCSVCGPRIRQVRAEEIERALLTLLETPLHWGTGPAKAKSCPIAERERAQVGTVLLLTVTLPHDFGEPLHELLDTIAAGHSAMTSGRAWMDDKAQFLVGGYIRAHDATDGQHGWHPHLHSVLCIGRQLAPLELLRLKRRLYVRWARSIVGTRPKAAHRSEVREGDRRVPSYRHGVDLEQARSVEDVARYAAAVAGDVPTVIPLGTYSVRVGEKHGSRLGLELTRNDLKAGHTTQRGRQVSRTPWEILRDIRTAPVCDSDGVDNESRENDIRRWREWEQETRGRQAMRWSSGLKATLGVLEVADEQIVAAEIGGALVHDFTTLEWWAVCGTRGAPARVLEHAEGYEGGASVRKYLAEIVPDWLERRRRDRQWTADLEDAARAWLIQQATAEHAAARLVS